MASLRLCALLVLCLLPGLAIPAFSVTGPTSQNRQPQLPTHPIRCCNTRLPPDKLEKAYALYLLNGTLYFVTTAWSFLVLYLMLRTQVWRPAPQPGEPASRDSEWCRPSL